MLIQTGPPLLVKEPVKVLAPSKIKAPKPSLYNPLPPESTPATVSDWLVATTQDWFAPSATLALMVTDCVALVMLMPTPVPAFRVSE